MRRVVVTGLGLVTPLGTGVEAVWQRLLAGESGIGRIARFDASAMATRIAGEVPMKTDENSPPWAFNPDDWMEPKERRKVDDFILYGVAAAVQALKDSGWEAKSEADRCRAGTQIGSGIGGIGTIEAAAVLLKERGPRRISPFFIPSSLINLISGQVSIRFGLKGPNHSAVTACSTGAHAIGDAARSIMLGDADLMVAGGAEAAVTPLGIAGFCAARAMATEFNDNPKAASRPWDKNRDGFVMGEGAGVVVLEEYEYAKARGARIYAEVVGYGLSGDAYHITTPSEDGDGAFRSMKMALDRSGLKASDIDYVNAHGTSTPAGDEIELGAVRRLFGDAMANVSMSSTKSSTGHLLGAAGAVEAIFCILALRDQIVPPTLNLDNPADSVAGVDLVPHVAKKRQVRAALSNSFGFGGTNASLILKRVD